MAESASFEVRGWITTFGMPIRGALYIAALFLGAFALWMLVATLRKFWPTWPSPYAHAMKDAAAPRLGAPPGFAAEIRKRGEVARLTAMQNLGGLNRPGGTDGQYG